MCRGDEQLSRKSLASWDGLYKLVSGGLWNQAIARLGWCEKAEVIYGERCGPATCLHLACERPDVPMALFRMLIDICPNALRERDCRNRLPIHVLANSHSVFDSDLHSTDFVRKMKIMLERYPEAALERSGSYETVLDTIEICWLELLDMQKRGEPVFSCSSSIDFERRAHREWNILVDVIRMTDKARRESQGLAITDPFLILHAAVKMDRINIVETRRANLAAYNEKMCWLKVKDTYPEQRKRLALKMWRNEVLEQIISNFPEQVAKMDANGNFPLHLACQKRSTGNVLKLLLELYPHGAQITGPDDRLPLHQALGNCLHWFGCVKCILDAFPAAAKTLDRRTAAGRGGRLPLHLALENGFKWDEGVKQLLMAAPQALRTRDMTSHFYPFMTGSVRECTDLNTVYCLLREAPDLLQNCHQRRSD